LKLAISAARAYYDAGGCEAMTAIHHPQIIDWLRLAGILMLMLALLLGLVAMYYFVSQSGTVDPFLA
jgi:hypothetical protein